MNRCTALLICPVCGAALARTGGSLRCERRHTFDIARAGYVDLLPPGHGASGIRGDARPMLEARRRFLGRGHYDPVADAINAHVHDHLASAATRVALDAGCGEGWYTGRLARTLNDACVLGCDVSRDALRLAARTHRDVTFFVNDVAHRISVRDASVDVLLNVFAPRNSPEFARVLRRAGLLLVVIPAEDHLSELRERLPLLNVPADKRERTLAQLAASFATSSVQELRYAVRLGADDVRDVIRMGPSYWHLDAAAITELDARDTSVTVAVHVLALRRS